MYVAFDLVIGRKPHMSAELPLKVSVHSPRNFSDLAKSKRLLGFFKSSDLQSYRCPPDAAGSLHCPSHVIQRSCNIHFGAKIGTVSMVLGINVI